MRQEMIQTDRFIKHLALQRDGLLKNGNKNGARLFFEAPIFHHNIVVSMPGQTRVASSTLVDDVRRGRTGSLLLSCRPQVSHTEPRQSGHPFADGQRRRTSTDQVGVPGTFRVLSQEREQVPGVGGCRVLRPFDFGGKKGS